MWNVWGSDDRIIILCIFRDNQFGNLKLFSIGLLVEIKARSDVHFFFFEDLSVE